MDKYIDNYGNEIDADYVIRLPVKNIKEDAQAEEVWRRLALVDSNLETCRAKHLLHELLTDLEFWMEENPSKSPMRWTKAPQASQER